MFTHSSRSLNANPLSREASSSGASARSTQSPVKEADSNGNIDQPLTRRGLVGAVGKTHPHTQRRNTQNLTTGTEKSVASIQVMSPSTSHVSKHPSADLQVEFEETVKGPGELVPTKYEQAPVPNMRPDVSSVGNSKVTEQSNAINTPSLSRKDLTLRTGKPSGGTSVPGGLNKPSLLSQPLLPKVSGEAPAKLKQLDSEDDAKSKPCPQLLKPQPPNMSNRAERPAKTGKTQSVNPPLADGIHQTCQTSNGAPNEKHASKKISSEMHVEDEDDVNMADVSDISDEEAVQPSETVTPFRAKVEARRKKLLANFDSDVFDSLIYRQSKLRPPTNNLVSSHAIQRKLASYEGKRVFLPVNPAIHRLHKRSHAWYKRKCEEIRKRPRRKAWFGKVMERRRWLHVMKLKLEKQRHEAQEAGTAPPFEAPEPRSVKRILDFGDVPEDELPAYVKDNPAWLKACAWLRECEEQAALRQRRVDRSKEEAERFFNANFGG
ncbi:hypothetical protein FHETE_9378 [Fusarium heterosporum]|uniref:Uncharacterized protein n=1 Tax=Fusarium heterosporum TaxID=42747 RepID=A0A8H5SUX1_FUSHE|nr:hypothetical protein FHETE_9378 [Fusarium heterosporum]